MNVPICVTDQVQGELLPLDLRDEFMCCLGNRNFDGTESDAKG
jgi:hypothetical protein